MTIIMIIVFYLLLLVPVSNCAEYWYIPVGTSAF